MVRSKGIEPFLSECKSESLPLQQLRMLWHIADFNLPKRSQRCLTCTDLSALPRPLYATLKMAVGRGLEPHTLSGANRFQVGPESHSVYLPTVIYP